MDLEANLQNGFYCLTSGSLLALAKNYSYIEHFYAAGKMTVCNSSPFMEWLSTTLQQSYFKCTDLLKEYS